MNRWVVLGLIFLTTTIGMVGFAAPFPLLPVWITELGISKAQGGLPAPGFFDCARRLGRFAGDAAGLEAWAFHAREFNAAVAFWAATATNGKSG